MKIIKKNIVACCFLSCLMGLAGCSEKLPDGFPKKLTPFTVKLLYEGKPVTGASVSLIPDVAGGYLVTAQTGNDGVAKPETFVNIFSKAGVPAGSYKAVISYVPKSSSELTPEEMATLSNPEITERRKKIDAEIAAMPKLVPNEWSNLNSTPVRITVLEKAGGVTIEITDSQTFVQ
ncbi:MAG: DUF4198 domain-containing protein [Planctomycetaceae bacterium]|nr:DUF4198 domain-containing protein [Planctomycetaceae bacterium]